MAKIKARGREEVFRVEKSSPPASGRADISEVRHYRALMSDGNVLERMVIHYSSEEVTKNYGKRSHDYGWKVRGRARAGLDLEALLKIYLDKGWDLVSASPSYFDVRPGSVEAISREPFITEAAAEKRRTSVAKRRERGAADRAAKRLEADGPGYYVTNGYTGGGSLARSRVADHPKPFSSYEEAEDFAAARLRHLAVENTFHYLLPVLVVLSESRDDAEQNVGSVLWVDGKYKGPPVSPRQMPLF